MPRQGSVAAHMTTCTKAVQNVTATADWRLATLRIRMRYVYAMWEEGYRTRYPFGQLHIAHMLKRVKFMV